MLQLPANLFIAELRDFREHRRQLSRLFADGDDGLGRELRTRSRAFDATNFVHVDTRYDSRGRVKDSSEPYFDGQTPTWNTPAYDVLSRPVGVIAADATQSTTTDYNAFTITTTDAGGRQNRLIADALGRTKQTEELNASGVKIAVTEFVFDKAGNVTNVQKRTAGGAVIANTVITNTFDRLGRRVTTTDPDVGLVYFVFDSIGDLRRQQTPRLRNQSASLYTEFDYDKLGRMTYRRDPSNDLLQTVTSTFTYDQVPASPDDCRAGIGHLTTEAISGGSEPGLTTTYCYSPAAQKLGRLANEQRTTDGVTYRTDFTYDVLGRLQQVRYPATTTWPSASRYAVNYSYTPRGHLERVQEAQGSNAVLFHNMTANARGQIEKAYMGDGSRTKRSFVKNTDRLAFTNAAAGTPQVQNFVYGYDAVGNVSGRADLINSVSETFAYDALDRLTSSTVTNGTAHTVSLAYDGASLGNMTHKNDISDLASGSMTYGTAPHAIQTLNTGTNGTRTFTYNANGAITSGQVASTTRTLAYTSYDLLASATIGTTSRTFSYGPDRARYKQVWTAGSTRTYTYVGEHYVKEVGASTEHKLYIMANGEPVAYVSDDGTPETRYLHKDHLGSITTIVTNQNVAGREKLSYDAWGKRRSGTDWWSAPAAASEERGYTGHEHLDDVTLIHMNGRVYDPQLARMTSPDPFVPAPLYSQSYNRYAYVYNNPLKYTDPSGFFCEGPIRVPWCIFVPRDSRPREPRLRHDPPPRDEGPRCLPPSCFQGYSSGYDWLGDGRDYNLEAAIWHMGYEMLEAAEAAARAEATLAVAPDTAPSLEKTDQEGVTPQGAQPQAQSSFVADPQFWKDYGKDLLEVISPSDYGTIVGPNGEEIPVQGGSAPLGGLGKGLLKSAAATRELLAGRGAAGSRALVPAVDAVYATATERIVAGYNVWGNAARVGSTYNVNVLGLYATESSQGLGALVGALRTEAAAAGASRISIQGLAIVNEGVAGISARAAARYGLQVERINANTIILTGGL